MAQNSQSNGNVPSESAKRLVQHEFHEDNIFNERQNYFLVAESLLLMTCAALLSSTHIRPLIPTIVAVFGLLLTLVWIFVNVRQWQVLAHIRAKACAEWPDHHTTYSTRPKTRISSMFLLKYVVPTIIGCIWAVFIVGV